MSGAADGRAVVVVPCYNEAARLQLDRFDEILTDEHVALLFVDDGSSDDTAAMVHAWASDRDRAALLRLRRNAGKGEAVRHGVRAAVDDGAALVAYYDADLASPPSELLRVIATLRSSPDVAMALGSRVGLLGARIERHMARHYQGRVFATAASLVLRIPVYDTQCGLKAMRTTPALRYAVADPFQSRWAFDVELLSRLLTAPDPLDVGQIIEIPLQEWRDVGGSTLTLRSKVGALADLARLAWRTRRS